MIRFGLSRGAFGWGVWLLSIGFGTFAGYVLGVILGPWHGGPLGGTILAGALFGAWLGSYVAVPHEHERDPESVPWAQMTTTQRAAFIAEAERRRAADQGPAGATRQR